MSVLRSVCFVVINVPGQLALAAHQRSVDFQELAKQGGAACRKLGGASVLGPQCNAIIGLAAASGYLPGQRPSAGEPSPPL